MKPSEFLTEKEMIYEDGYNLCIGLHGDSNVDGVMEELNNKFIDKETIPKIKTVLGLTLKQLQKRIDFYEKHKFEIMNNE